MPQVVSADLSGRFEVLVDPDADPVDLDEAVVEFLLSYIRKQTSSAVILAGGSDVTQREA